MWITKNKIHFKQHLVHKSACMKAQTAEEHLFAEDVHFFDSDEKSGHTGSNDRAARMKQVSMIITQSIAIKKL